MSFKIEGTVQLMMFPNFLKVKACGQEISISVGDLSDSEAEALWDHWKPFWRAHVAERRGAPGKEAKP